MKTISTFLLFLALCLGVKAQSSLSDTATFNFLQVKNTGDATYRQTLIASTNPCRLLYISGYNLGTNIFVQVINTNIVATNGMTPIYSFPVTASNGFQIPFGSAGAYFETGCSLCISTNATNVGFGSFTNSSLQAIVTLK